MRKEIINMFDFLIQKYNINLDSLEQKIKRKYSMQRFTDLQMNFQLSIRTKI